MNRLEPFGSDIWLAEGPVLSFYGFSYPTRMAIIRLKDGRLFVWSPIALAEDLKADLDALGPVAFLVSPNKLHHLAMNQWKAAYRGARLYASPGLAAKRRDIAFDAGLGDAPEAEWIDEIDQCAFHGSLAMTEIVFFHHASRTAIFADLIENFPPGWFKGWRNRLARLDGLVNPDYGAPREWRLTFIHRAQARAALRRILAWQPQNVIIAHGMITRGNGEAFIRKGFRWLMG